MLGVVMLLTGVVSAGIAVWMEHDLSTKRSESSNADGGWKDDTLSPEDSKISSRQSEMLYGKVGALLAYCWRRCAELDSPEGFAIIFATISTLAALGCFVVANRL
jgi:hypothetical protein